MPVADVKMASPYGALFADEASGPQRVFEGDLVVPLMSPWMALPDLLRLAQTNRACMREIEIGVREIGLTEFEDPPTGRITDAVIASISRRFPSLRVLYLIPLAQCWSLRYLELLAPRVTNESISYLSRLDSFKLSSNDRVTPAAFVGLIRRSPHIWAIHCLSCKHLEKSNIFWHCYREFENDLQSCLPAMQSLAWSVPIGELRELPPAAIAALGIEFEEA